MERRRPNYYDDMDPHESGGENGSFHRLIRILLTLLMAALIILSAAGLVWMFRSTGESPQQPAVEEEESETVRAVRETLGREDLQESAAEPDITSVEEPLPVTPAEEEQEETGVSYRMHPISEHETLEDIARQYSLDPRTLVSVNRITSLQDAAPGRELRIPDRDGQLYTIRPGDSLSRIAHAHGMGYITLALENNMDPNAFIYPGNTLFIPRITMSSQEYQRITGTLMVSPVNGRISTPFRGKVHPLTGDELPQYPGVEIAVPRGSSVSAAMGGRVTGIYHNNEGLGRYIEIAHDDGYETVYGHLDQVAVREGQQVERGEKIAESGSTGLTLEPALYFSISRNGIPLDPAEFF